MAEEGGVRGPQRSKKSRKSESPTIFSGTARWREAITRRSEVQVLSPQPTLRTEKDIGSKNPETTAVSGFCYAIFQGMIKKISYPQNDLWGGLELNLLQTDWIFDIIQLGNETKECLINEQR